MNIFMMFINSNPSRKCLFLRPHVRVLSLKSSLHLWANSCIGVCIRKNEQQYNLVPART
jgi:hypothetical protein